MDKNNNKGFSLVELLIALAVGGIVLSALTMLIQNSEIGRASCRERV